MKPSVGLLGLLLALPPVLAADSSSAGSSSAADKTTSAAGSSSALPQLSTVTEPAGAATTSSSASSTDATSAKSTAASSASDTSAFHLTGVPTIAGYGIPTVGVPDTSKAPFMQKSNLPDGTVFICVGAALGFLGACVLAWRGLVAWSLHRSVKRAAMAQNVADMKAMSGVPGKKRGFYNAVGANSTMSLDRLSAAPTGTSRPPKPFASTNNASTPPKNPNTSSLFFSPTAGGAAGLRDPSNRSSQYLPAGYYASGTSQAASGSPMTHVGGSHTGHLSTHSLATPGNRFSARSGISPPVSPSLPPSSRGYDRAPGSRDGLGAHDRRSVATLSTPGGQIYANGTSNPSHLSLNTPGGSTVAGGRAPSAYLEDLFENHGNGPRERY